MASVELWGCTTKGSEVTMIGCSSGRRSTSTSFIQTGVDWRKENRVWDNDCGDWPVQGIYRKSEQVAYG